MGNHSDSQETYAVDRNHTSWPQVSRFCSRVTFYFLGNSLMRQRSVKIVLMALLWVPQSAGFSSAAEKAESKTTVGQVTAPPAALKLSAFYARYISANGYPIVGSAKVDDYALKEAAYLVNLMLAKRPDVRDAMVKSGSRLIVMDYQEMTTQIPEYSGLRPVDYWDRRARGLGGSRTDPVCSCAEENLLCYPGDPYSTENILIHEFAHNIHLRGLVNVDPSFDDRLKQTYKDAMQSGLWKGKYAASNKNEYWAEGVQSWFNNNRPPDSSHNHVDTREELNDYDPGLAALCDEVFGNTKFVYTRPATRLNGHMQGFVPADSPHFRWPDRLKKQAMRE